MNDHRWSLEHLPWYLNGTLVGEEQARVHRHLEACTVCQRECVSLQRIGESLSQSATISDNAPQALALLQGQLRVETGYFTKLQSRFSSLFSQTPRVIRYAVAAQALLLVGVGGWIVAQTGSTTPVTGYQTLSQGKLSEGDVRLVFSEDATIDQQRALLRQFGLVSVANSTERGVLTLRWSDADSHVSLSELRAQAIVQFAESLERDPPVNP